MKRNPSAPLPSFYAARCLPEQVKRSRRTPSLLLTSAPGRDEHILHAANNTAVAESGDLALDGGAAEAGDRGGLRTAQAAVQQPEDEQLTSDVGFGVAVTLGVDNGLLWFGQP